jgi:hypothetical protein
MIMINRAKYLSLLVLLGAWGCNNSQYVSKSGGGYDDLYGSGSGTGIVTNDRNTYRNTEGDFSRSDNPDYYASTQPESEGTSDYYDESYLSSRGVQRSLSGNQVGYNAGFVDGYNEASRFSPYNNAFGLNNGLGGFWPGSGFSMNIGFGMGNMFRMNPYMGFGMGSMMGMGFGYSPFGYNRMMMGYSPFGYDPFGYGGWGYSPFNSMYGFGGYGMYDSFYGGYGYNPWAYSRPVIVVNNVERRGISRTYGPRVAGSRSNDRYNSGFVNNGRSTTGASERSGRRSASGDTYSSPRSASRSYDRSSGAASGGRVAASEGRTYSRGNSEGNNVYYSRPRATGNNGSAGRVGSEAYSAPRSTRSSGSGYTAPSRSQSNYSAPTRTYSAPRSDSYSAPSRTYNAPTRTAPTPSYSAPSRSYSAPASSGGGGGASRSPSRGPR